MAFITVAGETQIAVKQGASQILDITHFVLANIAGLGAEPVNRVEAMPAAGNIMSTLPVTSFGYVNGNQVVYSLVMDSSIGDFDFNWVGLKDADGVLIACTYTPLIQKRKTTGAIPGNNLTRNFLIAFSGIQATTAIAVPAETWQIDFNARLWGIDERERLSNYDIYGHQGFFGDGWKVVRDGATTTYNVQPGVGYVGGVRIAGAIVQPLTVAGPPKSIWLDVSLQGDISSVSAVVAFVIDAAAHTDYTDNLGFHHYVTKIADIAADGSVADMRVSADNIVPQPEAEAGVATTIRNWTAQRVRQAINVVTALKAPLESPAFTGNPTAPTPSLFNNGGSIASTEFIKKVLGNFSGYYYLDASAELSVTHLGGFINLGGNTPNQIYTLPGLSSTLDATMSPGLWLCNISGQPVTLKGWETETLISPRGAGNTLILALGESCFVAGNDGANWNVGGLTLAIGVGQTNRDKTAERALNTIYTNNSYSPKTISIMLTTSIQAHAAITITDPFSGVSADILGSGSYAASDQACFVCATVPAFHTYQAGVNTGTASLLKWVELY
ncbi:phage tail protein [Methylobacter sp. Wu8]|uniref:phage tail-collar fiber domain-containing protein n=1 Tax=Methylobacter sp. Wu8 TaxID=3118457 RepID=UPI002F30DE66